MAGAERARGREGGGKGREGMEKVLQGLVGCRRTWGFILREKGALKCCRQRGGNLNQVLTGILWMLLNK